MAFLVVVLISLVSRTRVGTPPGGHRPRLANAGEGAGS
jgi:hypothetical protein